MELDELKDTLFDFQNENDLLIADIELKEDDNMLIVKMVGGNAFDIIIQEHQD